MHDRIVGKRDVLPIALGCFMMFVSSCSEPKSQEENAVYETVKVQATDIQYPMSYTAAINGRQDIEVFPQISGKIEKVCISEGQKVKKGQTLFIIDQIPYKAALMTAKANVESARASLASAELSYNSAKELLTQRVISQNQLTTAKNTYLTAVAQLSQAAAQELNASNNLAYTDIKSPCDGVIGMLPYRVGALVGPNNITPLTTVSDNSDMYVYFSMTENQLLALIRKYDNIENAISEMPDIELKLSDGTSYPIKGRIESISGVIDKQTGTVGVRSVFSNPNQLLHSGSSGSVILPSKYSNCLVIPQTATVQLQDKYLVYKVVDGKAKSTLIQVAPENDGQTFIVIDGLVAGDEIIANGAGLVREGISIKQKNDER